MRKLLTGLLFALSLAVPQAYAEMISPFSPATERERVTALLERPEVAQQLEKMGIPADQARERVAAMSEAEVISLAGRLDAMPAGGAMSNQDLIILLLVIVLVILIL